MAYQVVIPEAVFDTLNSIISYLEENWSKKIAENFIVAFYEKINIISKNPKVGRKHSQKIFIRKILITGHNVLYYDVCDDKVNLLGIFFNVQNPKKNKFEVLRTKKTGIS